MVALKTALDLAFADRYGWHRDTFYYAVAGRHLQGGYVEFPPVTALVSALARVLYGWSLLGFRSFPILAGAGTVVVGALVARELGGGRRAQIFAAIAIAFAPGVLATNDLFQPISFDQLTTMIVLWLALAARARARLLAAHRDRRWDRARNQVLDRCRPRPVDRDVPCLAAGRLALLGVPAGGRDRWVVAGAEPGLGGRPRLGERALVPQPAAQRQRRDAAPVRRERAAVDADRRRPGRGRGRRLPCARSAGAAARLDGRRHCDCLFRPRRQVLLRAAFRLVRTRSGCDPIRALGDQATPLDCRCRLRRRQPPAPADHAAGATGKDRRPARRHRRTRRLPGRDRLARPRTNRRAAHTQASTS